MAGGRDCPVDLAEREKELAEIAVGDGRVLPTLSLYIVFGA
jgi:hypothetical protein